MVVELSYIQFLEGIFIGLTGGVSFVALLGYYNMLKGFPEKNSFGKRLLQGVYSTLRVSHVVLFIIFSFVFVVFGMLDGSVEFQSLYGFKLLILLVNAFVSVGMTKHWLNVHIASPVIVAGWTFLSLVHGYALSVAGSISLIPTLVAYLILVCIIELLFYGFRRMYTVSV